ncbi:hypothetical protein D3C77_272430 [compost metagenome]
MSKIVICTGHPGAGRIYAEELERVTAERDQLQRDKNITDQRVDDLESAIKKVRQMACLPRSIEEILDAALKVKGHE